MIVIDSISIYIIIVIFQSVVFFIFLFLIMSKKVDVKFEHTKQHLFDEADWPYVEKLLDIIDNQKIFYRFKFVPYLSTTTHLLSGCVVTLVDIKIDDKELTEDVLYDWLVRIDKRQLFDSIYLEWLFSYLDGFPQKIKSENKFSIRFDLSENQYEGIVKDVADMASLISLPCNNIEVLDSIGSSNELAVQEKIKLMKSYGIKINWIDFGGNIKNISTLISYDFNSITLNPSVAEKIDEHEFFKRFMMSLVEIFRDRNVNIRIPKIEENRIVDQLAFLGADEYFPVKYAKGLTGEEFIKYFDNMCELR